MASPSTTRWLWRPHTANSAIRLSSSCEPILFSFPLSRRSRRRTAFLLPTFSAANFSCSCSSSSRPPSPPSTTRKKSEKDSMRIGKSDNGSFSTLGGVKENSDSTPVTSGEKVKDQGSLSRKEPEKNRPISLKSLFGKEPFRPRVLFASKKVRSIILLNVITVIYASNIPIVKGVEAITDPAAFTFVRFAVSAIPFIPSMLRARADVQTRKAGIELGFYVGLGYVMQALGLLTSDAGRASFITLFTVIVVPLIDGMLGSIVPASTWFGALMSVIGVAMLESSGSPPSVGDLLNFLSAVFLGIHMLRTERISRNTKKENFLPLLGYEVCVVALLSTVWYLIGGRGGIQVLHQQSWTWKMFWDLMITFPWVPALYTGVFSTGFCLWVEMTAMRDVSATETAIIYGLEPLWGAGFSWVFLGERWGTLGWIGATLILGGSLTVQILGSSSSRKSIEDEDGTGRGNQLAVSDKRTDLSTSPEKISSRKNVPDILNRNSQIPLPLNEDDNMPRR